MTLFIDRVFLGEIGAALIWGLFGGYSHCIGMCGIFVLSAGKLDEPNFTVRLIKQLAFQCGRLVSLTIIGALVGAIGSLVNYAHHFAMVQAGTAIFAGSLTILLALGYVGILPNFHIPEPDMMSVGGGAGRKIFLTTLRSASWFQPVTLGLLVGFLPCGLTYTVAITAASAFSALRGALILLVFGLGTIPGLLTLGFVGHAFNGILKSQKFRIAMTRGGAIAMLITGIVLVWRGLNTF